MILYIVIFFLGVFILHTSLGQNQQMQNMLMTWYMLALGIFVGLSDMFGGYDRYIYCELFDRMADKTHMGLNPWNSYEFLFYGSEFGYGTFCALMSYITGNRYIFVFTITMVIYVLMIKSIKEYADNAPFATLAFMGLWFFFTFTYLRQAVGCTIAWLSIRYIVDRDLKRFLLVMFLAFAFHNSSIVFLPMYWLPMRKFPPRTVIYVMVVMLLLGLTPFPSALFGAYGELDADRMTSNYTDVGGFRVAYLIEAMFFLYVILKNYDAIPNEPKNVVLLNIAIVFCAILLLFVKSENGGRLGWIFLMGVFCTLSTICVQEERITKYGQLIIVVSFFLFLRIYTSWQIMDALYPYKTFLTNGYRIPDLVREKHEYDYGYDVDKFYRPAFWIFEDNNR